MMICPFPATFFARAHPMLKRKRREVKVENTACKLFDSLIIAARTKCGRAVSLRDLYRYQRLCLSRYFEILLVKKTI